MYVCRGERGLMTRKRKNVKRTQNDCPLKKKGIQKKKARMPEIFANGV